MFCLCRDGKKLVLCFIWFAWVIICGFVCFIRNIHGSNYCLSSFILENIFHLTSIWTIMKIIEWKILWDFKVFRNEHKSERFYCIDLFRLAKHLDSNFIKWAWFDPLNFQIKNFLLVDFFLQDFVWNRSLQKKIWLPYCYFCILPQPCTPPKLAYLVYGSLFGSCFIVDEYNLSHLFFLLSLEVLSVVFYKKS